MHGWMLARTLAQRYTCPLNRAHEYKEHVWIDATTHTHKNTRVDTPYHTHRTRTQPQVDAYMLTYKRVYAKTDT